MNGDPWATRERPLAPSRRKKVTHPLGDFISEGFRFWDVIYQFLRFPVNAYNNTKNDSTGMSSKTTRVWGSKRWEKCDIM